MVYHDELRRAEQQIEHLLDQLDTAADVNQRLQVEKRALEKLLSALKGR